MMNSVVVFFVICNLLMLVAFIFMYIDNMRLVNEYSKITKRVVDTVKDFGYSQLRLIDEMEKLKKELLKIKKKK